MIHSCRARCVLDSDGTVDTELTGKLGLSGGEGDLVGEEAEAVELVLAELVAEAGHDVEELVEVANANEAQQLAKEKAVGRAVHIQVLSH